MSFTNSSGKVETFTEFPFVLKNIGEYTYGNGNTGDGQNITATLSYVKPLKDNPDEYYPDMSITRSIFIGDSDNNQNLLENKKRKFDKVTSNTISLASMTSKFEDNYKKACEKLNDFEYN